MICHELGHHLGGFPYVSQWAANEGQADYFATLTCLHEMWQDDLSTNEAARNKVDPVAKASCDRSWQGEDEQNLCYRIMMAGYSLSDLFRALERSKSISFATPDNSQVGTTYDRHPKAQCRLDTYAAGALCTEAWDIDCQ